MCNSAKEVLDGFYTSFNARSDWLQGPSPTSLWAPVLLVRPRQGLGRVCLSSHDLASAFDCPTSHNDRPPMRSGRIDQVTGNELLIISMYIVYYWLQFLCFYRSLSQAF